MKLINLGLPKSGTTSLDEFLNSNNIISSHWQVNKKETGLANKIEYVGQVIYDNHLNEKKIFDGFDTTLAISQCDVCLPKIGLNLWPQMDHQILDKITSQYPDCKLLLLKRSPNKVISSIRKWNDLYMRIVVSDIIGLPAWEGIKDTSLATWVKGHYKTLETKYKDYDNFLSIDIEKKDSIKDLCKFLEIDLESANCKEWPRANVSKQRFDFSADIYWLTRELNMTKNKQFSLNKRLLNKENEIKFLKKDLDDLKKKLENINKLCN